MFFFSDKNSNYLYNGLSRYTKIDLIHEIPRISFKYWFEKQDYNLLIVTVNENSNNIISELFESDMKIIFCSFGKAENLKNFPEIYMADGLILSENKNHETEDIISQIIFGGIGANGKLKNDINEHFKQNDGIKTQGSIRFNYINPQKTGLDSSSRTPLKFSVLLHDGKL